MSPRWLTSDVVEFLLIFTAVFCAALVAAAVVVFADFLADDA